MMYRSAHRNNGIAGSASPTATGSTNERATLAAVVAR
jgi:hypothetical protein